MDESNNLHARFEHLMEMWRHIFCWSSILFGKVGAIDEQWGSAGVPERSLQQLRSARFFGIADLH